MKGKKLLYTAAAALSGVLLMTSPVSAYASNAPLASYQLSASIPAVNGLRIILENNSPCVQWLNDLTPDMAMCIEWSTKNTFPDTKETNYTFTSGQEFYFNGLAPGTTYYIRARICSSKAQSSSPWSVVLTYTEPLPDVVIAEKSVDDTSVFFNFEKPETVTGYEIYRAGRTGSYQKIAKISDNIYTDSGLAPSDTYRYKIRAYTYNTNTGKSIYGDWSCFRVTTWGSDLHLKASPVNSNYIKVKWNKVPGATGYKVYRLEGTSKSSTIQDGRTSSSASYQLVKTLTSRTYYKDRDVNPGESYQYKVVAFKSSTSRTLAVSDTDTATLKFGTFHVSTVAGKDGSKKLSWKRVIGASGYLIEVKDPKTGRWNTWKTLKPSKSSCVLPKSSTEADTEYRICAFNDNRYSNRVCVSTTSYAIGKTGQITVSATSDGQGVNVSWSPVPEAAYYVVYRSTRFSAYNADLDSYSRSGDMVYIPDGNTGGSTCRIKGNSVTDRSYVYRYDTSENYTVINEGPKQGIKYYYYVQAYKSNGHKIDASGVHYEDYIGSSLYARPAGIVLNSYLGKPSITAVSTQVGQATISWQPVTNAKKYYVYRSTSRKTGYSLVAITSKTSYTNKKLTSGATYYYKVKAFRPNAAGADQFSGLSKYKKVLIQ